MAEETEDKKNFWDSNFWQNLKGGKLGDIGTEVYFTNDQLVKIGATVVFVAIIIIIVNSIAKLATK